MYQKHVMLDLETLDTGPDSAILSIGAVEFAPGRAEIASFYRAVHTARQTAQWGRTTSQATIEWWSQQSPDAQWAAFHDPDRVELDKALVDFTHWLGGADALIWGYGSTFDNVIISNAYKALSLVRPWGFRNDRCFRTLKNLVLWPDVPGLVNPTKHNSLEDARYQAAQASAYLSKIKEVFLAT